ncbi:MAG TPA: hypothetical protein VF505_00925 [Thermoanaerobaculia bacterium]
MVVHLGNGGDQTHAGHRVEHVSGIRLHQTDEGADVALDVTALDGTRTTVRFRSPVLPELLDPAVE